MNQGSDWDRIAGLFERLIEAADPEAVAASESDPEIRRAARELWRQHVRADREGYLGSPLEFEVSPIFVPGQHLLGRFRIEKMLGSGGMGEVYLAWDERLEGRVALKTIARLLAPSPSIRKRLIAEVQSARRVTHPNVCRIHELFEDGETVFFSMEYVEGSTLSDWLAGGAPLPHARTIVRQMAEALEAAHRTGVVHGDFKPANVMIATPVNAGAAPRPVIMDFGLARALDRAGATAEERLSLRAGTEEYMAPELQAGGSPTVSSDIYAFGKVARQMLPGERIWDACTNPLPLARPQSLEVVIRRLGPLASRRYWIGGVAIVSALAGAEALRIVGHTAAGLPAGARILVNGFRSIAGESAAARLARSVLLHALGQSPKLQTIDDRDLLPALRRLRPGGALPASGRVLDDLLAQLRAAFWIDGDFLRSNGRYSLQMRLSNTSARHVVAASVFHDASSAIALAQSAAAWVRSAAGESERSLEANSPNVSSYTSQVPEALQKYYEALEYYAVADMSQAEEFLREAVRLDPNFAQAHCLLGQTINASRKYDESFAEIELALRLAESRNLPNQERTAIESVFYRATEDPLKMVEVSKRNVANHPADPRSQAGLGWAQVNAGDAGGAVEALRKAVTLAPEEWMHVLALADGLVEAGRYSEALDEIQVALSRGVANPWLQSGAGAAYMGLERYEEAMRAYESEPQDAARIADIQSAGMMRGRLEVAIATMEEQRASAGTPVVRHQANEFLCGLQYVSDRPEKAREHVREMADLPAYPPMARLLAGTISWSRRLGEDGTLAKARQTAEEIAGRWPNGLTQAVANQARASEAWRRNALEDAERLLLQSAGTGFSIWTLFDLAEFFTVHGKWDLAETYWEQFEQRRGTVLVKVWCPVILVLGWLHRAVAARSRNDRAKASEYARKVTDLWAESNPLLRIVQVAKTIN